MSDFDDILGHESIIAHLKNAIEMDKISHSYIFNGEDGIGKMILAKAFVKALQCEEGKSTPCNKCHSCIQAESGNQPDIIYVTHEKDKSIGVDDVRTQLINDIVIKPYSSKYKIYIIDEAQKLTIQAQNAILKTIEEPPVYGIIIFLTNNSDNFLPTILSRCIILNFKPVKDEIIKKYLMEKCQIPEYHASLCTSFAQGKPGRANKLAQSPVFLETKNDLVNLLRNIDKMEISSIVSAIKDIKDKKLDIEDCLDICMLWYRDVLLFNTTRDANMHIYRDELRDIKKQAQKSTYEGLNKIMYAFEEAKKRLYANVNFEMTMELLFLTMKEC